MSLYATLVAMTTHSTDMLSERFNCFRVISNGNVTSEARVTAVPYFASMPARC